VLSQNTETAVILQLKNGAF